MGGGERVQKKKVAAPFPGPLRLTPHPHDNSLVPVQGLGGGHGLQQLGDLGGAPVFL
jgi:hypothetical protein